MKTNNAALPSTHIDTMTDGTIVLTRWADKRGAANEIAENFREIGADFSRVLDGGSLGKFRIVGHIHADSAVRA